MLEPITRLIQRSVESGAFGDLLAVMCIAFLLVVVVYT